MNRIIKVYLKNVFNQKGFYICLAINIAMNIIIPFIVGIFTHSNGDATVSSKIISILSGAVGIVEVIFITIFVCSDFSEGATKNFISRGYTRRQVLYAKFIVSMIATFVFLLTNILGTFIFYGKNEMGFDSSIILYAIGAIAALVANVGLYVVISNTVEKLGIAIATNLILPNVVNMVFPLISLAAKTDIDYSKYWITGLTELMSNTPSFKEMLWVVAISLVYLVILFEVSNFIIKKKEVK